MNLFNYLITAVLSLALMAIDMLIFFWLVQRLSKGSQNRWIRSFNDIGTPLMETYYRSLRRQLQHLPAYTNNRQRLDVIAILELLTLRLLLKILFLIFL